MHLDTAIGGVNVPIAWFILFNMTVVMVLTPLFDTVVVPKLESWDFKFPVTWRMLSGLICRSERSSYLVCVAVVGVVVVANFKIMQLHLPSRVKLESLLLIKNVYQANWFFLYLLVVIQYLFSF